VAASDDDAQRTAQLRASHAHASANFLDAAGPSQDLPEPGAAGAPHRPQHMGLCMLEPGLDAAATATGSLIVAAEVDRASGGLSTRVHTPPAAAMASYSTGVATWRGGSLSARVAHGGGGQPYGQPAPPPLEQTPSGVGFMDGSGVLRYRRRRQFAMDPELLRLDGRHSAAEAAGRLVATPPASKISPRRAPAARTAVEGGRSSPTFGPPRLDAPRMASLLQGQPGSTP
jgi:hypothetical protein